MSATSSENTNGARKRRGEKRKYHFCAKLAGGERELLLVQPNVGTVSSEKKIFSEKKRAGQSKDRQTLCLGAGTPRLGSFFFVLGCLDGSRLDSYIFGFRYFEYINFLFLSLIVKADQIRTEIQISQIYFLFSFLFHSISLHGRPACPNHKFTRCRPAPGTHRQYSLLSCTGLVWK